MMKSIKRASVVEVAVKQEIQTDPSPRKSSKGSKSTKGSFKRGYE